MKILQRNLNRSAFVVWEMWWNHNICWKWPQFASREDWSRRAIFFKVIASTSANNKHSPLQSILIHFPTFLCELTHYTNTHKQQPYCVSTLSLMTERSAERRVRQEKGWLAGGPLLRVATTRRTTDTFLFISHTTNVLLFKFLFNIVIGVRIIKEMPGSVASGTSCIILTSPAFGAWGGLVVNCWLCLFLVGALLCDWFVLLLLWFVYFIIWSFLLYLWYFWAVG